MALDQERLNSFLGQVLGDIGAAMNTALILVGPALAQEGFDESRLYAGDYDRRYRPVGTHPRFPGTGG